jgi:nicotinate dehydrogenase subunit B
MSGIASHLRGISRRDVLKGAGTLVVAIALPTQDVKATATALSRKLSPAQLDTYISIGESGLVTAYFGKIDMGQGVDVAVAQIVAEELDVPVQRVQMIMGDTALTVDQGGGSGSTGIERGAQPLRAAAAEARRILIELGAEKLKVPTSDLIVDQGIVVSKLDAAKRATYGELIGHRHFDVALKWNGRYGNALEAKGAASTKRVEDYTVVGTSVPRPEIAAIVFGTKQYLVDHKVPGMLHARVLRPPRAGAIPDKVEEGSIAHIRAARVVREGDFLAVVADNEWDAVRAATALQVKWSQPRAPFPPMQDLYDYLRQAPSKGEGVGGGNEDARAKANAAGADAVKLEAARFDATFADASRRIEAEYRFPFQSHACMAPACAVADYRDGSVTVWTGSQKPHGTQLGVSRLLKLPLENVRAIWRSGPGSYGRNDAGDAALEAALLSRAVGRPVRVQGMRHEGHAWDPKSPASLHFARAAFDAEGRVLAYGFRSKGFSPGDIAAVEANPSDTLVGMLTGWPNASVQRFGVPDERYEFAAKHTTWQTVAACLDRASPLRTAHFRDPLGPQMHFASESFIDEMASAVGADPFEFRLRHLREPRDVGVLTALRERAQWQPRPSGPRTPKTAGVVSGQGIAYTRRGNAVVAVLAEVEVNLDTGRVWPRKFIVAADQGLVINPLGLRRTIEGNIVMATSRTLHEEVHFTPEMVTSVDWATYPILDIADAPEDIDIVLVDHTDLPPYGAGEPSTRTVPAAIANAVYDATGLRLRQVPLTAERVKAAIAALA